jgi:TorA maturation chaperone TorD
MTTREPAIAVEAVLARAAVYALLGRAFAYPDTERLADVAARATQVAGGSVGDDVATALRALAGVARDADPSATAGEYVFLFDRQAHCPPYESAYAPAPNLAGKGAALADVAGFYAAFGLQPSPGQPDLDDHVGAELEFMSTLALREAYARADDDTDHVALLIDAERAFLADHLGGFAPAFAASVAATAALPYYRTAAEALTRWLEEDTQNIGATVQPRDAAPLPCTDPDTFTCPLAEAD